MVHAGAGLVAASNDEELAGQLAQVFTRAGVVCERSNDPLGVELAGAAKNAAALAAGATEAQGLNAAGAAAGHIFAEVWRYAESLGARPESMIGLAGAGDLVATALAPESRNRRAGELLAAGVPGRGDPRAHRPGGRGPGVGAACWRGALETRGRAGRPITSALGQADLRRAAAAGVGRAGARHGPPAGPPAPARPSPGFWRRVWRRLFRASSSPLEPPGQESPAGGSPGTSSTARLWRPDACSAGAR